MNNEADCGADTLSTYADLQTLTYDCIASYYYGGRQHLYIALLKERSGQYHFNYLYV